MTAHDLAADWTPWYDRYTFRVRGGRVDWDRAEYVGDLLRISRVGGGAAGLIARYRYVAPDTTVILSPIR